jgi:hypothetical protein
MNRVLALVALPLLACSAANSPDACTQAAAIMNDCHGGAPAGYVSTCQGDSELQSAADSMVEAGCTEVPQAGKGDGLLKTVFVAHCGPALLAAYAIDRTRNGVGGPLSTELKSFLRPHYGALVDAVRVTWDSELLDNWDDVGIKTDHWVGAQTFGHAIFVAANQEPRQTLAHELAHAKQVQRLGGLAAFAYTYCAAYYDAGLSYSDNALEVAAYAEEGVVMSGR